MKTILVTGSEGLVGHALRKVNLKYEDLNFIFISRKDGDLCDEKQVIEIFKKHSPEYVIHTAAKVGGIGGNMAAHADYFYQNILINSHVIHNAFKNNVKKLLAFSSVCAFPDNCQILKEYNMHEGPPFSGNFAYAHAKRMVDIQIQAYKKQHGISNYCSIIPCNIIGTNDLYNLKHGHVLPSLIHKIFLAKNNNTNLEVWGDGKSLREFIFADDLAIALVEILKKDTIPDKITIAGRNQYSIKEIVDILVKVSGFKGEIVFNNEKPNGQRNRQSDTHVFNSILPDFNFTNIEKSIEISYNWFEKNYPNVRL